MRRSAGATALLAVVLAVISRGAPPLPAWPTSDERMNFIANYQPILHESARPATEVVHYPAVLFSLQTKPPNPAGTRRLLQVVRKHHPGVMVGRYFSGLSARPAPRYDPPETVPASLVEDALLPWHLQDENRRGIDLRKPAVRARMIRYMIAEVGDFDFLSIDNLTFEYFAHGGMPREEWADAQYALVEELAAAAHARGVPVVVNTALYPMKWQRLIGLVDGITYEMPFHPSRRSNAELVEQELAAYRTALDKRRLIGLIPRKEELVLFTAAAVMLIRAPGDSIFVTPQDWPLRDETWMTWPKTLGRPQGAYARDGLRFTRRFANGVLTVDFANNQVRIQR